jgi:hypothetical protein
MENWSTEMKVLLERKTLGFSEQEKENISYSYLVNLLKKLENVVIGANGELHSKVSFLITEIPVKTEGKSLKYSTKHLNEISNLQTYVDEKFGFIRKGKYKRRYRGLGMITGWMVFLPVGVALGNIALGMLGLPIGLVFGIIYGNNLDSKAENENRTL